jgi:fluoroacetyl-CoA thioesterase
MSEELTVGTSKTRSITVDRDRTIGFMGEDCRVYATPSLIRDIEHACRDLIFDRTPKGEDSVGLSVSITHMAPTLLGMDVEVSVTIAEVDGRKIVFEVVARDPVDMICKGRHTRFVVNVEKTRQKLKAKAAKAGES